MAAEDKTAEEDALQELPPPPSEDADVEVEREEDAPKAEELDPETRARRDAALRQVRKLGDPVLRATALPVERFDEKLEAEVERMGELMHDALGIGLAATQLGVLHRVLVFRAYTEDPVTALVNPIARVDERGAGDRRRGLSEPARRARRGRAPGAACACGRRTRPARRSRSRPRGCEARVIQHEIDHLDGVLILDRISREARKEAMRAMREAQETASAA